MAPRNASARRTNTDENACVNLPGKVSVDAVPDRKVLADRNSDLENQLEALTNKLKEVELGKSQAEIKTVVLEKQVKALKKTKGFTPSLEGVLAVQVDAKDGEKKKDAKTKDNKPKHPQSSYLYFCAGMREQVKTECPDADFAQLQKALGEKWKAADATAKAPFEAQAAEDTVRYQAEMIKYNKEQDVKKEQDKALNMLHEKQEKELAMDLLKQYQMFLKETEDAAPANKKAKDTDPNKPKRNLNAYMFYHAERRMQEQKKGDAKMGMTELSKAVGEEWNKLTAAKKKKYDKLMKADLVRYQTEMEAYNAKKQTEDEEKQVAATEKTDAEMVAGKKLLAESKTAEEAKSLLKGFKKAEQEVRKHDREEKAARKAAREGMPKRPASAYLLFCNENRQATRTANPEVPMVEIQKLLAEAWKAVSNDEKTRLQSQADVLSTEYKADLFWWHEAHPADSAVSEAGDDTMSDAGN